MISKTKIGRRLKNKTDDYLVETMLSAKKEKNWLRVSQKISASRKNYSSVNLKNLNNSKDGDTIVVVGKVLGVGNVDKKLRVCALYFSSSAEKKIKEAKGETVLLIDEIKKNPKAEGVRIL